MKRSVCSWRCQISSLHWILTPTASCHTQMHQMEAPCVPIIFQLCLLFHNCGSLELLSWQTGNSMSRPPAPHTTTNCCEVGTEDVCAHACWPTSLCLLQTADVIVVSYPVQLSMRPVATCLFSASGVLTPLPYHTAWHHFVADLCCGTHGKSTVVAG